MRHYLTIAVFFILSASPAAAEAATKQRCWTGEVISAELGRQPLTVMNVDKLDPFPAPAAGNDIAYAEVTIVPDTGRSLGIYDYVLVDTSGNSHQCRIVDAGDGPYDLNKWEIKDTKPDTPYKLVFPVKMSRSNANDADFFLRFKVLKDKAKDLKLTFRNMGDKPFTPLRVIPRDGNLGLKDPVPPPKPKAKEPKKAAAKKPAKAPAKTK